MLAKFRKSLNDMVYFLKQRMCVYLRIKFQVPSVIILNFRRGSFNPPLKTNL